MDKPVIHPPHVHFVGNQMYAVSSKARLRWKVKLSRFSDWGFAPQPRYDWSREPVATFTFTGPDAEERARRFMDIARKA
jgi:hypothetical protein